MMIIYCVILIFLVVMIVKNEVTFIQHGRIINAIHDYLFDLITKGEYNTYSNPVEFKDTEHYVRTLFRLWDWGCTRILPKEKYEIIKPWLDKEKEKEL